MTRMSLAVFFAVATWISFWVWMALLPDRAQRPYSFQTAEVAA